MTGLCAAACVLALVPEGPQEPPTFATGVDASQHCIYDFLTRDPCTYAPMLSSTDIVNAKRVVNIGRYMIPLGKARTVREGEAVTVLAYGTMVHVAEAVCKEKGVDAEILDLRTLVPLDIEAIEASVEKTGRCLIVHEATRTSGFGAELSALVTERCFYHLEAPVERVTGFDTPYPHSLEWAYFPGPVRIGEAIDKILKD